MRLAEPDRRSAEGRRRRRIAVLLREASGGDVFIMRKVLKSDHQPLEMKPQEKSVWICMCGLSRNQPFCDGSHKKIAGEEDGKTYEYDAEGHRKEV